MELRKFKIRENLILRIAILFNNIDFLLKCGIPVNVRINSDLYTINKIHDLLSFFEDKGWYKYKNFRAYCALLRQEVDVKQQIQAKAQTALFFYLKCCKSSVDVP